MIAPVVREFSVRSATANPFVFGWGGHASSRGRERVRVHAASGIHHGWRTTLECRAMGACRCEVLMASGVELAGAGHGIVERVIVGACRFQFTIDGGGRRSNLAGPVRARRSPEIVCPICHRGRGLVATLRCLLHRVATRKQKTAACAMSAWPLFFMTSRSREIYGYGAECWSR